MVPISDYIQALVNLYGLVCKNQVIEIYSRQNNDHIAPDSMELFIVEKKKELLNDHYIYIQGDYFVSVDIIVMKTFDEELKAKEGKPYYLPERKELLKYIDNDYFEVNQEWNELVRFIKKLYWRKSKAEKVAREIQGYCQSTRSIENFHYYLAQSKMPLRNEYQANELISLIKNLAFHTRKHGDGSCVSSSPKGLEIGKTCRVILSPLSRQCKKPMILS